MARQRRAGTEERTRENREGTTATADGRRRGRLQKTYRPEEGQALGVLAFADGRIHHPVDGHGEAAQEGHAKETEGAEEEAKAGRDGRIS